MRLCVFTMSLALAASAQDAGKQQFQARCAGCHGEDGTGGAHGPAIVDVRQPRAPTRDAIRSLILTGTPDAGMPPFRIPESLADAIAGYVVTLRQPPGSAPADDGDSDSGRRSFPDCGCASCHMIRG